LFEGYVGLSNTYDEFFDERGERRRTAANVMRLLDSLGTDEFRLRQKLAEATFLRSGITFSVYEGNKGSDRIFPFDMIPRIVPAKEWAEVDKGLRQRVHALNAFLADVYGKQRIFADRVVPKSMVLGSAGYLPAMQGVKPHGGVYVHIAGIDLIRGADGRFKVLEDNARVPSGVSYVLENRMVMKKVFPRVFERSKVMPVEVYPSRLRTALSQVAPTAKGKPHIVVLTPGAFNSAYFEHSFLARRMGCDLVEGRDLVVENDRVYAKTTQGLQRVDVIYRRLDDAFLDPRVFRKDSMLGVPGLVGAYAKGHVTIANAIGNGVCDDKAVYPFVPDIIRYYLGEEPLLDQVETFVCARKKERDYVLENIHKLVVKAVNEAGGYGMLVGPRSTKAEQREFRKRVTAKPRNYIAQPLVELSTCPTWTPRGVTPRRVDLRPYIITGKSSWVLPGGLTRVALKRGSYVVNSSQGGGSKDTWVLEEAKR
jgi:uncharacterized circularly permuted ATP-grasp superfamily protein